MDPNWSKVLKKFFPDEKWFRDIDYCFDIKAIPHVCPQTVEGKHVFQTYFVYGEEGYERKSTFQPKIELMGEKGEILMEIPISSEEELLDWLQLNYPREIFTNPCGEFVSRAMEAVAPRHMHNLMAFIDYIRKDLEPLSMPQDEFDRLVEQVIQDNIHQWLEQKRGVD